MDTTPIQHALILTAGLGTRLRPLTDVRAKPAIPVAGEPIIRRIIRWLASQGVDDLVLNLHHRPDTITAVVGEGRDLAARVRYSWEQPRVLGSAGGPRQGLPIIGADPVFIINGDTLTDLSLRSLAERHAASGGLVTLALVPNREFERYGGVTLGRDDQVAGFVPRGPEAAGSYHYIGVQIAQAAAFASLPPNEPARSIGGVYDALMRARPGSVHGFVCDATFWDVGTIADYRRTSVAFMADLDDAGQRIGARARIDASASITGSILWDDVDVGADAVIDECIITDGARVPAGAAYRHAILMQRDDSGGLIAVPFTPVDA